jgi:hypothetical protein
LQQAGLIHCHQPPKRFCAHVISTTLALALEQRNALQNILFVQQSFGNVLVHDAGDQRLVRYALLFGALLQPGQAVFPGTDFNISCFSVTFQNPLDSPSFVRANRSILRARFILLNRSFRDSNRTIH